MENAPGGEQTRNKTLMIIEVGAETNKLGGRRSKARFRPAQNSHYFAKRRDVSQVSAFHFRLFYELH